MARTKYLIVVADNDDDPKYLLAKNHRAAVDLFISYAKYDHDVIDMLQINKEVKALDGYEEASAYYSDAEIDELLESEEDD